MSRVLVAALVVALPSTALAGPITAGVTLGIAQTKADADGDAVGAHGIFGRIRFGHRLGAQLELAKVGGPEDGNDIRSASVLLVVDLLDATKYRVVPMFLAGVGVDRQRLGNPLYDDSYDDVVNGKHVEGGFGVEYRSPHGLSIGLDLRVGSRELDAGYYDGGINPPPVDPTDGGGSSGESPVTPRGRVAPLTPDCDRSACELDPTVPYDGGYTVMQAGEYRSARIVIGIQF
jgi:hypothetical protein